MLYVTEGWGWALYSKLFNIYTQSFNQWQGAVIGQGRYMSLFISYIIYVNTSFMKCKVVAPFDISSSYQTPDIIEIQIVRFHDTDHLTRPLCQYSVLILTRRKPRQHTDFAQNGKPTTEGDMCRWTIICLVILHWQMMHTSLKTHWLHQQSRYSTGPLSKHIYQL